MRYTAVDGANPEIAAPRMNFIIIIIFFCIIKLIRDVYHYIIFIDDMIKILIMVVLIILIALIMICFASKRKNPKHELLISAYKKYDLIPQQMSTRNFFVSFLLNHGVAVDVTKDVFHCFYLNFDEKDLRKFFRRNPLIVGNLLDELYVKIEELVWEQCECNVELAEEFFQRPIKNSFDFRKAVEIYAARIVDLY